MKKKLLLVCVVALLLVGCGKKVNDEPITYQSFNGNYHLYETSDKGEYLDFLEKLDDEELTIVDIAIVNYEDTSAKSYIVTYKDN